MAHFLRHLRQMSKAAQIKALVKQICHGNSTAILPKLVDTAVSFAGNSDDAVALMQCLIDAIDMFASHPSAVHKCLFIVETCLRSNSQPFFEAAKVFAPEIRLIPLLTFERPKCQIRAQIHSTAFSIYHCLVHGHTIGEEQYEDAVQATFHRPLTDQMPVRPSRKSSDDGSSGVSFWDIAQGQAQQHEDRKTPELRAVESMPIAKPRTVATAVEPTRAPVDQFALFSQFPKAPPKVPGQISGLQAPSDMHGGNAVSKSRSGSLGSKDSRNPFDVQASEQGKAQANPFLGKKDETFDPFAKRSAGQQANPFVPQAEHQQEVTFDPFAKFSGSQPPSGPPSVDPFAQAAASADEFAASQSGKSQKAEPENGETFDPFAQFSSGQLSAPSSVPKSDPFALAQQQDGSAEQDSTEKQGVYDPFAQFQGADPFAQGQGNAFQPTKSMPTFNPFDLATNAYVQQAPPGNPGSVDPFQAAAMSSSQSFDMFRPIAKFNQQSGSQLPDPFANPTDEKIPAPDDVPDPFADMVVPEFSLELNIHDDVDAVAVIPAQLDPFAASGSAAYPAQDPFA